MRAETKLKRLMKEQTDEQRGHLSHLIEYTIREILPDAIRCQLSKYGDALERRLGMTREDLMNEIRVEVWKACLLHDSERRANFKTYAKLLIENRMKVLAARANRKKYAFVLYSSEEPAA